MVYWRQTCSLRGHLGQKWFFLNKYDHFLSRRNMTSLEKMVDNSNDQTTWKELKAQVAGFILLLMSFTSFWLTSEGKLRGWEMTDSTCLGGIVWVIGLCQRLCDASEVPYLLPLSSTAHLWTRVTSRWRWLLVLTGVWWSRRLLRWLW